MFLKTLKHFLKVNSVMICMSVCSFAYVPITGFALTHFIQQRDPKCGLVEGYSVGYCLFAALVGLVCLGLTVYAGMILWDIVTWVNYDWIRAKERASKEN